MHTIAAKILIALAAVALPALVVAGLLGQTLISTVSRVKADGTTIIVAARRIAELRIMMERERGLITRLPAELDQAKIEDFSRQIGVLAKGIDEALANLAATDGIIAASTLKEIRDARRLIVRASDDVIAAAKAFAQTTALELVSGPFEASNSIALTMLDAVTSQVHAVADSTRLRLEAGSYAARLFVPMGLAAVLAAILLSLLMVHRTVVAPLRAISTGMIRLAKNDLSIDTAAWPAAGDIGEMRRAVEHFRENAAERERLTAAAEAIEARQAEATIAALADGLSCIANGDLTCQIDKPFAPHFEQLRADFNAAVDKLQHTMLAVISSSEAIHAGAHEISAESGRLADRTAEQAATVEETAVTLNQITVTVGKTAESVARVRKVVATAKEDAEMSGGVVREVVDAMDGIAKSSRQINRIVSVIDRIAVQTKLLALNAGIEAARAGEAGRSFAVVASEVRALAQRSADAAREIKDLISTSGAQVEHGVQLVAEAGNSLERILAQVADISATVSDIAADARDEAMALQEINSAINQIDQVTQQNAAMAQESTAASRSLFHETAQLSRLIGRFQVGRKAQGRTVLQAA